MKSETKNCQNCKKDFTIESEDFSFYEKIKVPLPTFCPECRLQRRLTFRNERTFYKRPCDLCGKSTLSRYSPEKGETSYCGKCWFSDEWNPEDYAQTYDFSKPFFLQFLELKKKVPHQNLSVTYDTLINSEYTNMNHYLKDCYYIFNADYNEKCAYGEEVEHSTDCVDTTLIKNTQIAYESVNCEKCYKVFYSVDCENSNEIYFSRNLTGCSNCFGCINLVNQQYCIYNKKYSKEEYTKKISEMNLGSYAEIKNILEKTRAFWLGFPRKYIHGIQNIDSSGDYISRNKKVKNSFIVSGSEDCKYCALLLGKNNKECFDFTQFGESSELVYESLICGNNVYNIKCSSVILNSHDVSYSFASTGSNLFGCVALKKKEYCILNKQYTKEEYENMIPKIIRHMQNMPYVDKKGRSHIYGDFFPSEISEFDYNETSAQEYFPLTKYEALEKGYSWKEEKDRDYKITISPEDLSDDINDTNEAIISDVVGCMHQGKCKHQCTMAFKITNLELQFYKAQNIPLPRLCPNCRHSERKLHRNPFKLWHRQCMCDKENHSHKGRCEVEFETSYSPNRPEIVYCEKCYQQEVY